MLYFWMLIACLGAYSKLMYLIWAAKDKFLAAQYLQHTNWEGLTFTNVNNFFFLSTGYLSGVRLSNLLKAINHLIDSCENLIEKILYFGHTWILCWLDLWRTQCSVTFPPLHFPTSLPPSPYNSSRTERTKHKESMLLPDHDFPKKYFKLIRSTKKLLSKSFLLSDK